MTKFDIAVTKPETSNLTLFCEANGNPKPEIRWEFDKEEVETRYTFPTRGALFIANVGRRDEGRIGCIAENILSDSGWYARQVLSSDSRNLTLKFDSPALSDSGWYACTGENYVSVSERSVNVNIDASDCSSYKGNGKSGIYTINPDGKQPFKVFCDMDTNNGGWTVIQRRSDGSVDFFKNWVDYKLGFGSLENEFWLGNDNIHRLTKRKNMMIRFDLEDVDGNKSLAE